MGLVLGGGATPNQTGLSFSFFVRKCRSQVVLRLTARGEISLGALYLKFFECKVFVVP